jgi:hypothetical protein
MTSTETFTVHPPSYEQLEDAWFALMQGELGIDRDPEVQEFMRTVYSHVRCAVEEREVCLLASDGEPISEVTSEEMAKRMAAAYAVLFYGCDS